MSKLIAVDDFVLGVIYKDESNAAGPLGQKLEYYYTKITVGDWGSAKLYSLQFVNGILSSKGWELTVKSFILGKCKELSMANVNNLYGNFPQLIDNPPEVTDCHRGVYGQAFVPYPKIVKAPASVTFPQTNELEENVLYKKTSSVGVCYYTKITHKGVDLTYCVKDSPGIFLSHTWEVTHQFPHPSSLFMLTLTASDTKSFYSMFPDALNHEMADYHREEYKEENVPYAASGTGSFTQLTFPPKPGQSLTSALMEVNKLYKEDNVVPIVYYTKITQAGIEFTYRVRMRSDGSWPASGWILMVKMPSNIGPLIGQDTKGAKAFYTMYPVAIKSDIASHHRGYYGAAVMPSVRMPIQLSNRPASIPMWNATPELELSDFVGVDRIKPTCPTCDNKEVRRTQTGFMQCVDIWWCDTCKDEVTKQGEVNELPT